MMAKSNVIEVDATGQDSLSERDAEFAVKAMLQQMSDAPASRKRIEIRGFGSFSLHSRRP